MNIVHLNTAGAGLMSGRQCVCGQRLAPSVVLCRDQPALLKGSNALYAVDACQSLGQLPHNLPAKPASWGSTCGRALPRIRRCC